MQDVNKTVKEFTDAYADFKAKSQTSELGFSDIETFEDAFKAFTKQMDMAIAETIQLLAYILYYNGGKIEWTEEDFNKMNNRFQASGVFTVDTEKDNGKTILKLLFHDN